MPTTPEKIEAIREQVEHKVHFIQKAIGADTYMVMADSALLIEDEFSNHYFTTDKIENVVLQPPFDPKILASLAVQNNVLGQCVEAMEVNIDGTGHEFVAIEEDEKPDQKEVDLLKEFFNEPCPGKSTLQIRRKLRRDLESTGFGFLEILRNMEGNLVGFRNMESMAMRLLKLDTPVSVKRTLVRGGKEVEFSMMERERRFTQRVGNNLIFFKEFGVERQLNKLTGEWIDGNSPVDLKTYATEVLYFNVNQDVKTPYGVPRWINQLPSVIGSRKAEEANLEFFDAGGMPPAIIFIQGGTLAMDASNQLKHYLSGKNKNKNRAVVVEAQSSSGTLESAGSVQVKVERFGAERANDAMYANYDKAAEDHVRIGFRLPPLFIGKSTDYSFATAVVSYMVAEEQVFQPERREFDDIINKTIVKALGIKKTRFRSKPITLKTVQDKISSLQLIADKVEGQGLIDTVNSMAGMNLKYKEPDPVPPQLQGAAPGQPPSTLNNQQKPGQQIPNGVNSVGEKKLVDAQGKPLEPNKTQALRTPPTKGNLSVVKAAHDWGAIKGLLVTKSEMTEEEKQEVLDHVDSLTGEDRIAFNEMVSAYTLGGVTKDLVSLVDNCNH